MWISTLESENHQCSDRIPGQRELVAGAPIHWQTIGGEMDRRIFAVGSVLAGLGVVFGAFGAHALKASLSPEMLATFETGVRYQMYHGLGLLALAWAISNWPETEVGTGGVAATGGTVDLFWKPLPPGADRCALVRRDHSVWGRDAHRRLEPCRLAAGSPGSEDYVVNLPESSRESWC